MSKETTTTSLTDLIAQDGIRQIVERHAIESAVVFHGEPPAPLPPKTRMERLGAWLRWHWQDKRERLGFWIAGYDPRDHEGL